MPRILIVGKSGQIGWELIKSLQKSVSVMATGRAELDVSNRREVFRILERLKPDIVINATGYNNVDGAETHKAEAVAINVSANQSLAEAACQINSFYITYSTDYVFDGKKDHPYVEKDRANPVNVYGQTKLDGETAIIKSGANFLIFRTSSVFSLRRPCFLSNFLSRIKQDTQIRVRTDLVSNPTSASYLAEMTTQIISMAGNEPVKWLSERKGIYHLVGNGLASRYEWAREICDILGLNLEILPATQSDYPDSTTRPTYSALDPSRFYNVFELSPISWKEMLKTTLDEIP